MARKYQTGRYAGEPKEGAGYVVARDIKQVGGVGMSRLEISDR